MVYHIGESGNPAGRPPLQPGEKRRAFREQQKRLKLNVAAGADGHVNDLDLLQSIVDNSDCDVRSRMAAAGLHVRATRPPPPRTISKPVDIAPITNVEEAYLGIGKLAAMAAAGTIGIDEAADVTGLLQAFIIAYKENANEQDIRAIEQYIEQHPPQATIEVVGGNPVMPGHENIRMPERVIPIKPDPSS
jgi:hypothetical protein